MNYPAPFALSFPLLRQSSLILVQQELQTSLMNKNVKIVKICATAILVIQKIW